MKKAPTLDVIDPYTRKRIARLPVDTANTVRASYAAARTAQPAWAALPLRTRIGIIAKFRAAIVAATPELALTLTRETGKPIAQSRNELVGLLPRIDFFLAETARATRREAVFTDRKAKLTEEITWEPLGVVANISAWNYPYFVGCNVILPALLTGNAVLYKPSEFAAQTGLAIARLLHDSGVPTGAFTALIGTGEVGTALLQQPVDGVFFTGSVPTGRKIARAVAGRMIKLQLELGGKDPVYICDDADVATAAASTADGAFYNTGQSCCSVERIYVHEKILPEFVAAFVATVKAFKLGDPRRDTTYIGPLTRPAQIAALKAQVADARKKGATVLLGGGVVVGRSNFFQPTVLTNVNHTMTAMRDESFGPIIGIMGVRDDAEALALMNDTRYGLTAGVYTPDAARARRILTGVRSGSAYWNCCDRVSPRLPWSGVGDSGVGLTLSRHGIQTFTRPKAWHLRG